MQPLSDSIADRSFQPMETFQFERVGYFVVDKDTTPNQLICNLTVTLKESGLKKTEGKHAE